MDSVDVAVVGGGPVGLATAIHARQHGMRVCVLEKRQPPVDKACGEGLMPAGVAALAALGVHFGVQERHAFRGIRYVDGPWVADGCFAHGAVGWGVRRLTLAQALTERAGAVGVDLRHGCTVQSCDMHTDAVTVRTSQGDVHAAWLVGADGLHSKVRGWAGLPSTAVRARRFGVRRHFAMAPWSSRVEVHWARRAEAYVTPVSPNEVNIAFLWDGAQQDYDSLLRMFPDLQARVQGVEHTSTHRGAGPFAQQLRRRVAGRVALVGDAAGYLDAITGEGLTLGFRCGAALAQMLSQNAPLSHYETAYAQLSAAYYRSTAALLTLARFPLLRRAWVMGLATLPGAFDRLLAWHGQSDRALSPQWVRQPSR